MIVGIPLAMWAVAQIDLPRARSEGMLFLERADEVDWSAVDGLRALGPMDVDGDGVDDIVVAVSDAAFDGAAHVDAWSADGVRIASWKAKWSVTRGFTPFEWVHNAGDVDGDGRDELLFAFNGVHSLLTLPTGAARELDLGLGVLEIDGAGDLDGDGRGELIVVRHGDARQLVVDAVSVERSSTLWSYDLSDRPHRPLVSSTNVDVARLDDLDGDGVDDFACLWLRRMDGGKLAVLSGATGAELFARENKAWLRVESAGDVDGDGRCDLAVSNDGEAAVLCEAGATERFRVRHAASFDGRAFGLGDLDGDGFGEWLTAADGRIGDPSFAVLRSGADGRVLRDMRIPLAHFPSFGFAALGDLDGDGARDLLVCDPRVGDDDFAWLHFRHPRRSDVAVYSGRFLGSGGPRLEIGATP